MQSDSPQARETSIPKTPGFPSDLGHTSPCPACGSEMAEFWHRYDGIDLVRCERCKTIFMDPLPVPEEMADFYEDSYENASTGYFAKVEKKMKRSRGRMGFLARFAPVGRFLDVGSNGGFMVEAARERGFDSFGVDIDGVSVGYAKEHYPQNRFFHGTVESLAAGVFGDEFRESFDLAYSSEVIEHVPDAEGCAAAIAALLKPGGYLFITTPDISHWRRPRDVEAWDAFCPPSHCIYFNPDSLSLLLGRHGLKTVRRRPAFKPGIKLLCRKHLANAP